jgi:ferrous iron transport protein B
MNDQSEKQLTIALAGNPNAGKTSIFNHITGTRQKVGNWPGVTVEKKRAVSRKKGVT